MSNRYYYRPALFIELDIEVLVTRLDFTDHPDLIEITKQEYELFQELFLYFHLDPVACYRVWKC